MPAINNIDHESLDVDLQEKVQLFHKAKKQKVTFAVYAAATLIFGGALIFGTAESTDKLNDGSPMSELVRSGFQLFKPFAMISTVFCTLIFLSAALWLSLKQKELAEVLKSADIDVSH